jgi:hypothetical protein
MRLDRNSDGSDAEAAEPRDSILALLQKRPYSTGDIAAVIGVHNGALDSTLKMLARQGHVDRLLDWRWRLVAGRAPQRRAKLGAHSVMRSAAPTVDLRTCERCGTFFQATAGASNRVCLRCDEPSGEVVAEPAPSSKMRLIGGVEYEVTFDGRGETPDWPTAWGSSLTGCQVLRL